MPQTTARNLSERLFFLPAITAIGKLGAALWGLQNESFSRIYRPET